jgi:hypothetical protein
VSTDSGNVLTIGADDLIYYNGGTGGHDPVTLAGTPDYLTLSGQQITVGAIDLAADVTGSLPYSSLSGVPSTFAPTAHDHASNKLAQANTHNTPDTDSATTALHHTLGTSANQAAAGNHAHTGTYEAADATILRQADVDDTPVNGVTAAPVSSNWAFYHAAAAAPHPGIVEQAVIRLSNTGGTVAIGARVNDVKFLFAHQILSASVGCDPSNLGSGTANFDINSVNTTTGASTSILTGVIALTSSVNYASGTLSGTVTGASGAMYDVDCDQASDAEGVYAILTYKRT